jgi:hypothetical protein
MQAGLYALTWSLQRLGIGFAIIAGLVVLSFVLLVLVIVVSQAAGGLAQ